MYEFYFIFIALSTTLNKKIYELVILQLNLNLVLLVHWIL